MLSNPHISLSICIVCYNTQPHQLLTLIDSLSIAAQRLNQKFAVSTIPIYVVDNAASDKNLCHVIDEKKDPEFLAMNSDLSSVLKKALDQIPIEQRIIVELKNIEGRSHKEIAEYLDISVTAAKVRLHRAHQKLRHILEEIDV